MLRVSNINFDADLSADDIKILDYFLNTQERIMAIHADTSYLVKKTKQYIRFNKDLIPYVRENGTWGFNVYDSKNATNKLGKGNYGTVRKIMGKIVYRGGQWRYEKLDADEEQRALKEIEITEDFSIEEIHLESELLQMTSHSHSKPVFIEQNNESQKAYIAQRLFKGENLQDILGKDNFTTDERIQLSINLLLALKEQIHDRGILHRDIKPGNILVDRNTLEVKIIDVGLSRKANKEDNKAVGTPYYVAPELIKEMSFIQSDLFSMGLLLFKLWKGESWRITFKNAQELMAALTDFLVKNVAMDQQWVRAKNNLFSKSKDLDSVHQKNILKHLEKIFSLDINKRGNTIDFVNVFKMIQTERLLPKIEEEKNAALKKIKNGHVIGRKLASEINEDQKRYSLKDPQALDVLQKRIETALKKLDKTSDFEINAFIDAANINIFKCNLRVKTYRQQRVKEKKKKMNLP